MAITRLADAYPAHKRSVIRLFLMLTAAVGMFEAALLLGVGVEPLTTLLIVSATSVVLGLGTAMLIPYMLEPLDHLSRVITHASNQPNNVTLPNLNGTRHEANGYKQMIDTIYELILTPPEAPAGQHDTSLQESILNRLPCGVIALDEKRNVVFANTAAPVTTGDSTAIQLLFEGEDTLDSWIQTAEDSKVEARHSWSRIQNVLPGQANRKLYDVTARYEKNGRHGIDTLIITLDKQEAYGKDEENMDFIALAAHELRGPVTVIHGYLDILRRELQLDVHQTALFDRLEVSASKLSGYISNILNASKYDRRHLKLHLHEEKLHTIYSLIADDMLLRAKTQNRALTVDIPSDLPAIAADRSSLSEVLANFIDNAIKYSNEGGGVTVSAEVDGNYIKVKVVDKGIGIPSSVVGNLFSKFYRSHRSRATVSGTGLGLYIAKAIVESHGGHVGVSSKEGEGSTFTFTVPVYSSVKDKLLAHNNENKGIIETSSGWIKNHAAYRG